MGRTTMNRARMLGRIGAAASVVVALGLGGVGWASAAHAAAPPAAATDSSKVPHYFGPWPNWALSPLTTNNAVVKIVGDGTGAEAVANVDPMTGVITGIDVTKPGRNYTFAQVNISGGTTSASATATLSTSGGVTAYTVGDGGHGYKAFSVAVTGADGTGATGIASGGVDAVAITDGGSGFTMPTVEFGLPDLDNGTVAKGHVATQALDGIDGLDGNGTVTKIVVDDPGKGYTKAPDVIVRNGTVYDPLNGSSPADLTTTLKVVDVTPVDIGTGFTTSPTVTVTDAGGGSGSGAVVTGEINKGAVSGVKVLEPGAGFLKVGIRKFQDQLPLPCDPAKAPDAGGCPDRDSTTKYIPVGVPEARTYSGQESDVYTIGLVQYRSYFNSDLPEGTLARGYVQIETPANAAISRHWPLENELLDGTKVPVLDANKNQVYGVTPPQWLGPFIQATKDRAVRVIFHNYLPTGVNGNLFLPADTTMMGSGMGPMGMTAPTDNGSVLDQVRNPDCTNTKGPMCFTDNRATLHLHGGVTPWISDGTPHQWITPANESTDWPQGVSVQNVPDMADAGCDAADDGCQTFYYTNQQSARLMFYHDHSWGITRLNVYAGEAAGYSITDDAEKQLVNSGTIPAASDTIPLIVQDRTFTPDPDQLAAQDPTWDAARWGTKGSFWYHHVYMPAQNPGDPSGMSAYGRWMYGPWFWPPAAGTKYGPIANPYYDPNCKLDDPKTWTYQTDPFCEPEQIPGTPNISAGMEQFNDTPIVNGVAYPTITLQPKSYRLRLLNAANDRFFNLQWYTADPEQGNGKTEVELNAAELKAAQTDPNVSPTPAHAHDDAAGPDWVQIASEGGWLPAPAVIDGQQPTTWITDPTRFDVGNVDQHSMLIAPAERADTIVDFSKFAGKTLILYNDAPAAFPARVSTYDYYTGGPDLAPNGAPPVLPGYGPNTRTIMQVKIAADTPAAPFDLGKLTNAFKHTLAGTGVFEKAQHPIIVGQSTYNSAYGSSFTSAGNCSLSKTLQKCDGLVRVNDTAKFSFNTLRSQSTRQTIKLEPKAIHDEMNSTTFDEFGRMQANLGVEASPPTPGNQNVTLYPFVNPATEIIDGTNLPTTATKVTPIAKMDDGTQIWRITHNGVDTHPIHFHLYDVQVINRVTWDNIIIPPDPNELGWKDTVRTSPLEDTIVALRPVIPTLPFEIPNSIRPLDPMMPLGSTAMFHNVDVNGNPTTGIINQLSNFGWEYVYHCHILSHEEMDMMRPVLLALPPKQPGDLSKSALPDGTIAVNWSDNSITETSQVLQRSGDGTTWTDVGTIQSPLDQANVHEARSMIDPTATAASQFQYRVVAKNTVGYGGQFPGMTVQSVSTVLAGDIPVAPAALTVTQTKPETLSASLAWSDKATTETGYAVERSTDAGATWTVLSSNLPADSTSYVDATIQRGVTYDYRVAATNAQGQAYSNTASLLLVTAPTGTTTGLSGPSQVTVTWTDTATNETGFTVLRSLDGTTWTNITPTPVDPVAGSGGTGTFVDPAPPTGVPLTYRVGALNGADVAWSDVSTVSVLAAPSGLTAVADPSGQPAVNLTWVDNTGGSASQVLQRSSDGGASWSDLPSPAAGTMSTTDGTAAFGAVYTYRVGATNASGTVWSGLASVLMMAAPSTPVLASTPGGVGVTWTDNATNETSFVIERSADGGSTWTTLGTNPQLNGAGSAATFTDGTATAGASWTYRVGAVNGLVVRYSVPATIALVGAPANLTAVLAAGPVVNLAWANPAGSTATGLVVQRTADGGATWTDLAPLAATDAAWSDATVTTNNTYGYRVVASNGMSSAASNTASVTLVAAPTAVTATSVDSPTSPLAVTVTWTDNATSETGFVLERSADAGTSWTTVGTAAPLAGSGTTGSMVDTTATSGGSYQYRVGAAQGTVVAYSAPASLAIVGLPSNLTATASTGSSIVLAWSNPAGTSATSVVVQRTTDAGATWTDVATLAGGATAYTDSTVTSNVTYGYRVVASNGPSTAMSNVAQLVLVSAPTGVTVTSTLSAGTSPAVTVSWTDTATAETGFVIERSGDNGTTWTTVGTAAALAGTGGVGSVVDTTASADAIHLYRVGATHAVDPVAYSTATPHATVAVATGLTVTPGANASAVLTWTDRTAQETAYAVERTTDGGLTWASVATLPANTVTWTDSGLTRGASYGYRVVTSNASSTATSAATTHVVLSAPTGLAANVVAGPQVVLTWTDTSGVETGYRVEQSTNGGTTWATAAGGNLPANATTVTVPATAGVTYQYRVTALRPADAAAAAPVTVTVLAAPTNLAAQVRGNPLRVTLTWTDLATQETGYTIQRSADGGLTWTSIGTRGAVAGSGTAVSWPDNSVVAGTTYQYRVQVLNASGVATSNVAVADVRAPAAPTGLTGSATRTFWQFGNETLRANWTDVAGETGYTVQWSTNGTTVSGSTNLAANTTSWSRTVTRAGWYVRVGATNVVGTTWSTWVFVPRP